jgi:hypothetical protein
VALAFGEGCHEGNEACAITYQPRSPSQTTPGLTLRHTQPRHLVVAEKHAGHTISMATAA